jgi:hypothetical protein
MSIQLTTYIVLSLPLYHASRSFSFLNTSPSSECAFVFKWNKKLKELLPNSTDIKAKFVIDKYLEPFGTLHNLILSEFVVYYNSNNHDFKKRHILLIIQYVNYNKHWDLENYYQEQLLLFHPFTTLEESQLENHESWHDAYNAYESLINDVCLKFIYKF